MIDLLLRKMQPQDRVERLQGATQLLHRPPSSPLPGAVFDSRSMIRLRRWMSQCVLIMDASIQAPSKRMNGGEDDSNPF
jgi:hypothetical protein